MSESDEPFVVIKVLERNGRAEVVFGPDTEEACRTHPLAVKAVENNSTGSKVTARYHVLSEADCHTQYPNTAA